MCLRPIAVFSIIAHFFLHKNRFSRVCGHISLPSCGQVTMLSGLRRSNVSNIREGVVPPLPVSSILLWRPGRAAMAHLELEAQNNTFRIAEQAFWEAC